MYRASTKQHFFKSMTQSYKENVHGTLEVYRWEGRHVQTGSVFSWHLACSEFIFECSTITCIVAAQQGSQRRKSTLIWDRIDNIEGSRRATVLIYLYTTEKLFTCTIFIDNLSIGLFKMIADYISELN